MKKCQKVEILESVVFEDQSKVHRSVTAFELLTSRANYRLVYSAIFSWENVGPGSNLNITTDPLMAWNMTKSLRP